MLFAYFAPETVLPATSALATAAGFLLIFGRRVTQPVVRWFRRAVRLDRGPSSIPAPHLPGIRPSAEARTAAATGADS